MLFVAGDCFRVDFVEPSGVFGNPRESHDAFEAAGALFGVAALAVLALGVPAFGVAAFGVTGAGEEVRAFALGVSAWGAAAFFGKVGLWPSLANEGWT